MGGLRIEGGREFANVGVFLPEYGDRTRTPVSWKWFACVGFVFKRLMHITNSS